MREIGGGNVQAGRDPLDDDACSTGAFVVHGGDFSAPALQVAILKEDDFGILTAQLDNGTDFRISALHGEADSRNLLNEACSEDVRQVLATAAGHEEAEAGVWNIEKLLCVLQGG